MIIFFFKQKTAYEMRISDWSSDVCSSDLNTPAPVSGRRGTVWPGRTGTGRIHRRNQRNGQCSARSQRGTRRSFRRYCIGSSQALAVPAGSCPIHDAALDFIQPPDMTPSPRPFLADINKLNPPPNPVYFILDPTAAPTHPKPLK